MTTITQYKIIKELARRTGLSQKMLHKIIKEFIDILSTKLSNGLSVRLLRFGKFVPKLQSNKTIYNIYKGKTITLKDSLRTRFYPSKILAKKMNCVDDDDNNSSSCI